MSVGFFLTTSSRDPAVFSLLKGTVMVAVAVVGLTMLPLKAIPSLLWPYVFVSGLLHGIYILALSKAYESGDISYVYPIARAAPALVPVAAFLLIGETISLRGTVGIIIVVLGVLALQFRGFSRSAFRHFGESVYRKEAFWAFITLGAVVSYSLVDKAAMVMLAGVSAIPTAMSNHLKPTEKKGVDYETFEYVPVRDLHVVDAELKGHGENRQIVFGDAVLEVTPGMQIPDGTGPIKLSLRPEILDITSLEETSGPQTLRGVVVQRAYMGPVIEYSIKTRVGELFTRVPAYADQFEENDEIGVTIRPEDIIVVSEKTGATEARERRGWRTVEFQGHKGRLPSAPGGCPRGFSRSTSPRPARRSCGWR